MSVPKIHMSLDSQPNTLQHMRFSLRLTAVSLGVLFFGCTLVLPSLIRTKILSWAITVGIVNMADHYIILFGAAPLFALTFIMYIRNLKSDTDVIYALDHQAPKGKYSGLWTPRHHLLSSLSKDLEPWSKGDLVVSSMLIATNLMWFVIPVILQFQLVPTTRRFTVRYFFAQFSTSAAMAGMWNGGLAIVFAVRENLAAKAILGNDAGQYHRGIRYHIGLGYASFGLITYHCFFYLIAYSVEKRLALKILPWMSKTGYLNCLGMFSWIALILMIISSIFKSRRSNYRIFYWTHQLYVVFLVLAFAHAYQSCYPLIAPLLYFIYDRILPRIKLQRNTNAVLTRMSPTIVQVDIPIEKAFLHSSTYAPGDWINLLIPSISSVNWHPYTIGSYHSTSPKRITLFIKNCGPWTQRLFDSSSADSITVPVKVDGVFGSRSTSYLTHKSIVFVGGGTGIAALIPYLMHYSQATTGSITLVWVAQSAADICVYRCFLEYIHTSPSLKTRIKTHIHLTSEIHSEMQATMSSQNESTKTQNQQSLKCQAYLRQASSDSTSSTFLTQESSAHIPSYGTLNAKIESHQIPLGMVAAILAIVMFSSGIFGYVLGRLYVPGYDISVCASNESVHFIGMPHFICRYYHSWAPNILSCTFAAMAGLITTAIVNSLRLGSSRRYSIDKSGVALSLLQADDVRPYPIETFIEAFNPLQGRPDLDQILGNTFINDEESATDISKVAVMAAGPESLVREVELITMNAGQSFYRESWKI
ncbi:hypothetical protein BASA60_004704 [Batrachochytrium salamandrivorans]|nr:hypothetical protein BASA60_004704 [Batrachochytrium salamandrivorans]KAH9266386.1 hypothetical protein BASA83_010628 [Batrachochytrium salamandrivorans]